MELHIIQYIDWFTGLKSLNFQQCFGQLFFLTYNVFSFVGYIHAIDTRIDQI